MRFSVLRRELMVVLNHPSIADAQASRRSYHSPVKALEQFAGSWLASCALERSSLRGSSNRHLSRARGRSDSSIGGSKAWSKIRYGSGSRGSSNSSFSTRRNTAASAFITPTQGQRRLQSTTSSSVFPSIARLAPTPFTVSHQPAADAATSSLLTSTAPTTLAPSPYFVTASPKASTTSSPP
jgi:hypothetical protein